MINTKHIDNPNWKSQKDRLRTEFPSLTDEDVNYAFGKKDEMIAKLSEKLGKTAPELLTILRKG
jgi:hypothetical protein